MISKLPGIFGNVRKVEKMNSFDSPLRKLRFCKWVSSKMQQIKKQAGPSRQLFETVNFVFMKFFHHSIKTDLFGAILVFLDDFCHKLRPKIELGGYKNELIILPLRLIFSRNLWCKSPKKSREAPKIFIEAKLTVSKSCLLGPTCFMICCILGDAHLENLSFLRRLSTEFIFFNFSYIVTYPRKLRNQN